MQKRVDYPFIETATTESVFRSASIRLPYIDSTVQHSGNDAAQEYFAVGLGLRLKNDLKGLCNGLRYPGCGLALNQFRLDFWECSFENLTTAFVIEGNRHAQRSE